MKLLSQTHSPFARKVVVLIHELELEGISIEHHETSPTNRNAAVFAVNPMGQVPVLVSDTGTAIFDSSVICDYLCGFAQDDRMLPVDRNARATVLRQQAIASGMCEVGIAVRWEVERRPEELRYPKLRDGQIKKLHQCYGFLETDAFLGDDVTVGTIALACALEWLSFRGLDTHAPECPRLESWLDRFRERASMQASAFAGQTHD